MVNDEFVLFLGKNVKIIKKDGFRKFGLLKESSPLGIILEFYNGEMEFISKDSIESLMLDLKVTNDG